MHGWRDGTAGLLALLAVCGAARADDRVEVDVINGAVVDLSRELGLTAPYNETLCAILRERESRFE